MPTILRRSTRNAVPYLHGYSRAYLHHLSRCGEILGSMLLTAHNLHYYADLMRDADGDRNGIARRFRRRFRERAQAEPMSELGAPHSASPAVA